MTLCSRDRQMEHDAIAFGDELVNLLVVVRKRCPRTFHHGADALVPFTQGVWAIVPDEVQRVELRDTIEATPVPNHLGNLAD